MSVLLVRDTAKYKFSHRQNKIHFIQALIWNVTYFCYLKMKIYDVNWGFSHDYEDIIVAILRSAQISLLCKLMNCSPYTEGI
jgi:hypothetical protein